MTSDSIKSLSVEDFEGVLGEKLSSFVAERIRSYSFQYAEFSPDENDELLIKIVQGLLDPNLVRAGNHRLDQWETGWGENLDSIVRNPRDIDLIMPKYFNKYGAIRWNGKFIRPVSAHFEYLSLAVIQDWLFDQYLRDADTIYEFGCGTGHNLLRAREFNRSATLWGLDWATASQQIISLLAQNGVDADIHGQHFDYFNPDESFRLEPDSIIYTVASLEQVGAHWNKFIEYILRNKPRLCVHIEPISELLDPNKILDFLSIEYFKKRNYLKGFLYGLRQLETEGKVQLHRAQRTHIGSLFIEGYSVIVWSPV